MAEMKFGSPSWIHFELSCFLIRSSLQFQLKQSEAFVRSDQGASLRSMLHRGTTCMGFAVQVSEWCGSRLSKQWYSRSERTLPTARAVSG